MTTSDDTTPRFGSMARSTLPLCCDLLEDVLYELEHTPNWRSVDRLADFQKRVQEILRDIHETGKLIGPEPEGV